MDGKHIVIVGVIGGGRAARMAIALQAAGMAILAHEDVRTVDRPPSVPEPRRGSPDIAQHWDGDNRKRAQWKNETNKRGRNR